MTAPWPVWLGLTVTCMAGGVLAAVAQISVRALGRDRQQELIKKGLAGRGLRAWLEAPLRMLLATVMARVVLPALAALCVAEGLRPYVGPTQALQVAALFPLGHLLLAEVVAASWAKHRAALVANPALTLFLPFDLVLWPVSAVLALLARRTAGWLAPRDQQALESGPFLLEEDMARLWGLAPSPETGAGPAPQHQTEARLLRGVLEFKDAVVRDVMVPRSRMLAVDVETPGEELMKLFARHGHTRMPVYQGSVDSVVGVLFLGDVLRLSSSGAAVQIRPNMRRPFFVPELMKVGDLLREFQKRRTHLAVVVDEFGTTSGLVTLQDVIEEIVGDVRDEEDVQDPSIKQLGPQSWLMDGRTSIDNASVALTVTFPGNGAFETLGGFLITRVGRLPAVGSVHRYENLVLTVKEADERRVVRVQVEKVPDKAPPEPAQPPEH
jgi:putative hemolysin